MAANLSRQSKGTKDERLNAVVVRAEKGGGLTRCSVRDPKFIMYYFTLLFLLAFTTPVLITTSLNVYITNAVRGGPHEIISHHQWLTLGACVAMWGPCLTERLLSSWQIINSQSYQPVSVFLFLLGHTHNLLRCVLHAVFAQQMQSSSRHPVRVVSWREPKPNKVAPSVLEVEEAPRPPTEQKRKNTLTPRAPCVGLSRGGLLTTPQPGRRATIPGLIPNIHIIETTCT